MQLFLNINAAETGIMARNRGMRRAEQAANTLHGNWSEQALEFVRLYALTSFEFMTEDIRESAANIVPEAPSARAWGPIMKKAQKAGYIAFKEIKQVRNAKAHMANANVWRSLLRVR